MPRRATSESASIAVLNLPMSRENNEPRVSCSHRGLWSAMVRVPIHCWLKVKRDEEKVIEEDYIEITIGGLRTMRTAEENNAVETQGSRSLSDQYFPTQQHLEAHPVAAWRCFS